MTLFKGGIRQGMLSLQVPERQGQHGGTPRGAVQHGGGRSPLHPAASVAVNKGLRPIRKMAHQPVGRSHCPSLAGDGDGISILMAHLRHALAYPRDGFAIWFPSGGYTELVRSPAQRPVQPVQPCRHPKMKQDIR
jgi:hypothetical protein